MKLAEAVLEKKGHYRVQMIRDLARAVGAVESMRAVIESVPVGPDLLALTMQLQELRIATVGMETWLTRYAELDELYTTLAGARVTL